MSASTLLDGADWTGNIFLGGSGGRVARVTPTIVEPATGDGARPDRPGRRRRRRRRPPARPPRRSASGPPSRTPQRAAVLRTRRRALRPSTPRRSSGWNVREVGAVPAWPASRCTSPSRSATRPPRCPAPPYGELLPSEQPRLSMAQRVPAGVVAVISPFNVPLILASARSRRRWRSATRCCSSPTRAPRSPAASARPDLRGGRPARRLLQLLPGGADVGRGAGHRPARAGHLVHRLDRRPAARVGALAGRAPQARAPRARRQLGDARARRRRRRAGGEPRRRGARSSTRARSA